jgi:hypothetical protein
MILGALRMLPPVGLSERERDMSLSRLRLKASQQTMIGN